MKAEPLLHERQQITAYSFVELRVWRWELLQALTGRGVVSIREAARRVGRDVKAVHGDVQVLIHAGVIDRTDGGTAFPYDAVHVNFVSTAA